MECHAVTLSDSDGKLYLTMAMPVEGSRCSGKPNIDPMQTDPNETQPITGRMVFSELDPAWKYVEILG